MHFRQRQRSRCADCRQWPPGTSAWFGRAGQPSVFLRNVTQETAYLLVITAGERPSFGDIHVTRATGNAIVDRFGPVVHERFVQTWAIHSVHNNVSFGFGTTFNEQGRSKTDMFRGQ